ncbi:MAG TPA: hypothetical protein VE712_01130, partial [Actinomycetota bacterium]|nr:hypothetical protein [Actinomycetota bacterium]
MRSRAASRVPWAISGSTLLVVALALLLAFRNEPSRIPSMALTSILILAFSAVGALVASRRHDNPIGWLFCVGALIWMLGELALEYAIYELTTGSTLRNAQWGAWFGGWARGLGWFLIVVFLLLLFPNGRLPSPRWRPVLWVAVAFIALFTLGSWLAPTSADVRLTALRNPFVKSSAIGRLIQDMSYMTLPVLVLACGAAPIARFKRSRGEVRQQLKWFAYSVAVMVALLFAWLSLEILGILPLTTLAWTVPLIGVPVAVGVAILRYRLYDIDRIINRTLVYGLLTALLAGVYAFCVVAVPRLVGGTQGSEVVVAGSTLLVAALFQPARRRTQTFIDRHFNRSRYDATRTVEGFSV